MVANTHTTLLCFSNLGQVYWLKVYDIPSAGRSAKGRPLVNLIQLNEDERITSMVPVDNYKDIPAVYFGAFDSSEKPNPIAKISMPRWEIFEPTISKKTYETNFKHIKDHIFRGNFYQINYTYHLKSLANVPAENLGPKSSFTPVLESAAQNQNQDPAPMQFFRLLLLRHIR